MNTARQTVVPLRPSSAQRLVPLLEAVLFDAGKLLTVEQLSKATFNRPEAIKEALQRLEECLEQEDRGLCLAWMGDAVQLVPKQQFAAVLEFARQSDVDKQLVVLQEYLHDQGLRGRRPATLKMYEAFLSRFIRAVGKPVEDIRTRHIRSFFISEEQRGNSRSTIATKTTILREFLCLA